MLKFNLILEFGGIILFKIWLLIAQKILNISNQDLLRRQEKPTGHGCSHPNQQIFLEREFVACEISPNQTEGTLIRKFNRSSVFIVPRCALKG